MTFSVIFVALVMAWWRPWSSARAGLDRYLTWLVRMPHFVDGGEVRHAWLGWVLGVGLPAVLVAILSMLLGGWGTLAGFMILYVAFSLNAQEQPSTDLKMELERSLHGVFAPLLAFAILGAGGVVLFVLASRVGLVWGGNLRFSGVARQASEALDWLPARALALSFALAGHFDGALEAWRQNVGVSSPEAIVVASGEGALGLAPEAAATVSPEAAESLIVRVLAIWLGLLLLLALAT